MRYEPIPSFVPDLPTLKVTWPVVRKLFVETTEALTGYPRGRVLVDTKSDRRPADGSPYCSLWFKRLEPLPVNVGDWYYETKENDPTKTQDAAQIIDNESHATVQFNFWGKNAFDEATEFMQALHAQRRFQDLWRILGFSGIDAIQDISTQYGAQIQQRAYFNMDYYVCLGRYLPADWFDVSQWGITLPENKYSENWPYSKEIRDGNTGCVS